MMTTYDELCEATLTADPDVKKVIQQSRLQYDDVARLLNGKNKESIVEQGVYTRKVLVDAVFSLKGVCDNLFQAIMKLSEKNTTSDVDKMVSKFEDMVNTRFDNLAQQISSHSNAGNSQVVNFPALPVVNQETEKHMIIVNEKGNSGGLNEQSWASMVKGTLGDSLKEIPMNRSMLNKSGQGCLYFPNKKAQEDAQSVLEPLFDVISTSKPLKDVLPKATLK